MITISNKEARNIIIRSQFLDGYNSSARGKKHLLNIIQRLGYVQIDTISVVERSHNHILWSRMSEFSKSMLDELLEKDRSIFEYWSHAAAFLPMADFRYSLIRKKQYSEKYKDWEKANKKIIKFVYDRINDEGPLQSRDFQDKKNGSGGWWNWKPSKDALDYLFHQGRLMIAGRKGFQKQYDITERILPENIDASLPDIQDYYEYLICKSINSNGISSLNEMTYQRKIGRKAFMNTLCNLVEDKKLLKVNVMNLSCDYYTSKKKLNYLNCRESLKEVHVLSPFDNLVIQRRRLKDLFGFDYTIECYLPESRRQFGYYSLPILKGDKFIGRIDAKADRVNSNFIIKQFFPEGKVSGKQLLQKKIEEFARFCACSVVSGQNIL